MDREDDIRLIIDKQQAGKRLDVWLSEKYPEQSRSRWQKRIKTGEVLVNGAAEAVHYFLREGDQVKFKIQNSKFKINPKFQISNFKFKIEVVKEDRDYLIINKPAGVVVHPVKSAALSGSTEQFDRVNGDGKHKGNALVDWLMEKYPEIKRAGESKDRPGIVHRLDKEVSGLMVIARNQAMFDCLKQQFQERKVVKEYMGLVHKRMSQEEGKIDLPIKRAGIGGKFAADTEGDKTFCRPRGNGLRPAVTKYEVIKKFTNYTLLKIIILTGRTHQIRVHLRAIGHSVAGDKLYITRDIKKKKPVELDRLWLYAKKLGFRDLSGEYVEFECTMPIELEKFINQLSI